MKRQIRKQFIEMCLVLLMLLGCAACSGKISGNESSRCGKHSTAAALYMPLSAKSLDIAGF